MDPLSKFTDKQLFQRLFRDYEQRIVKQFTETITTVFVNGRTTSNTKIENERIEFGSPMDTYTTYAEFDKDGNLIDIGQSSIPNY